MRSVGDDHGVAKRTISDAKKTSFAICSKTHTEMPEMPRISIFLFGFEIPSSAEKCLNGWDGKWIWILSGKVFFLSFFLESFTCSLCQAQTGKQQAAITYSQPEIQREKTRRWSRDETIAKKQLKRVKGWVAWGTWEKDSAESSRITLFFFFDVLLLALMLNKYC